MTGRDPLCIFANNAHLQSIDTNASRWGLFDGQPFNLAARKFVQSLWRILLDPQCGEVRDWGNPFAAQWCDAAMKLLAVADAASEALGFIIQPPGSRPLADLVFQDHILHLDEANQELPYIPWSLCKMVPPEEVCVQPKTRTAQVGCTLRSLSHHLALLPSAGEVSTTWLIGLDSQDVAPPVTEQHTLNLLFVPFPYRIDGLCFRPGQYALGGAGWPEGSREREQWRFFDLDQRWLMDGEQPVNADALGAFFAELIAEAEKECDRVHALVLPELALDDARAPQVAQLLAQNTGLELFITGIASLPAEGAGGRNSVYSCIFSQHNVYTDWTQSKHHRWRLEQSQIERYHLGDRLHPQGLWWEHINIEDRRCAFYVFRHGMSLVTLICEDLARIDPVQAVIRAVGPNLVVALLMDGPQLKERWGGRYATVLADDPGAAVFVGTSMAFLRRQAEPRQDIPREVVLWKGAGGQFTPHCLAKGHHALLLTLTSVSEANLTLDGRSDEGNTFGLSLSGVRSIRHPDPQGWAKND